MVYKVPEEIRGGHCLECGEPISYGRKDKKFCCDKCKNRYNNRKIVENHRMMEKVNKKLRKNYEILQALVRVGVTRISKLDLSVQGYDFNYVTSYHKFSSKDEYRCYDIRYYSGVDYISHLEKLPSKRDTVHK